MRDGGPAPAGVTRAGSTKRAAKVVPAPKPVAKRPSAAARKSVSAVPKTKTLITTAANVVALPPTPARPVGRVPAAPKGPARLAVRSTAQATGAARAPVTRSAPKRTPAKGKATRVRYVAPSVRAVKVKELDPVARCGPDTSVELLYRVDERLDGRAAGVHLVFFDRYGWYCVHGRGCAAVADVHQDLRAQRRSVPRLAATTTRAAGR